MNLRRADLNLLKVFDVLMDERSVTRAAQRLALTQPAVSGMLNRLREAFGDALFVRVRRGVTPTARALELAGPVKRLLAELADLLTPAAFDPARADMTLSIATSDHGLRAAVVPFVAALRAQAPGIRVVMRPIEVDRLLERMECGELDLALMTPQRAPPDLHSRTVLEDRHVCVLGARHPLARRSALTLGEFCALNHGVVSLNGGVNSAALDDALARQGLRRRVLVSVPSFAALLDLVRATDLVALIPRRPCFDTSDLALLEPPPEVPGFSKILAWHARTHDHPAHRWVRNLLLAVTADQRP